MSMKKIILFMLISIIFINCSNVRNTNFQTKMTIDGKAEQKKEGLKRIDDSISVYDDGNIKFYYSNKDSFSISDGYTFYLAPYIVVEKGLLGRVSLRVFVKTVANKEEMFDKVIIYDKNNKLILNFDNIKKEFGKDNFLIYESGDVLLNEYQIKTIEKFIDSKQIFVIFEKNKKYAFSLNSTAKESFLNILRKYKLLTIGKDNYSLPGLD